MEAMPEEFFAMIGIVVLIILVITLAIAIVTIIGTWKVLEKGNKPGWGALIPIYNTYLLCDMVGVNPWWIVITICSPILNVIPVIGSLANVTVTIYFAVLLNVSLARAFKKEDGFAVGLVLLPTIFYLILGFGKDNKYYGKNPMKDILFDNNKGNQNKPNATEAEYEETKRYCPECGTKTEIGTKYCSNCGKKI